MASYFQDIFDSKYRAAVVKLARGFQAEVHFDTVAVRGVSGMVCGSVLAHELDCALFVARKPTEPSHAPLSYSGTCGKRVLLVDDFVSSGSTLRAIVKCLSDADAVTKPVALAGIFLYSVGQHNYGPRFAPSDPLEALPFLCAGYESNVARPNLRWIKSAGNGDPEIHRSSLDTFLARDHTKSE